VPPLWELKVSAAKYVMHQPILAVSPDAQRVDGILALFAPEEAGEWAARAGAGRAPLKLVTMAKASLNDGQSIYAFNDLFIGPRSHISLRYRLEHGGQAEDQSSSGIIVSTGAGSTGWLQSIVTGAALITAGITGSEITPPAPESYQLPWEADKLYFSVREPFTSRTSQASIVFGTIEARRPLVVESHMPENGVIFSDGVEGDSVAFNAGAVATVEVGERKARLVGR
jgi:hypothetical protein